MTWRLTYLICLCVALIFSASCKKEVDSEVRIIVKNAAGDPVENATVDLFGESTDSVYVNRLSLYDLNGTTNAEGLALFKFNDFYDQGDKGFAILTLEVSKDTQMIKSYVKVMEGEIIEQTVYFP